MRKESSGSPSFFVCIYLAATVPNFLLADELIV